MTIVPAAEAYREIAASYNSMPNPLLSLDRRTLPQLLPVLNGQRVIDVAAGTGYWANWCAARGARAIAVDFCWEMLRQAPAPAVLGDSLRLPFRDASADIAICSFGLGYAPGSFGELARIARPGGCVIASDMHPAVIELGWARCFRSAAGVVEVENTRYSIESLTAPGLELETLLEPCFGDAERMIFESAGKLERFEAAAEHRAIFAARWRRV